MQSTDCSLDVAGKAMGASSYGNTESDAYSTATKLFLRTNSAWKNFSPGRMLYEKHYNQTLKDGTNSKIKFIEAFSTSPEVYNPYKLFIDEIDWQTECDMARGIQDAFVKDAIKWFKEIMSVRNINLDDYDRNVVFSGGSALNVLFNDILQREMNINLFVPPNPADQGIPYGMLVQWMVDHATQYSREETTYSGQKIQDMEDLQKYYHSHKGRMTTIADVASILKDDKIVGLVQGGMEVGARALGNRSILADPKGADKKDKVNVVKRREAYRPFAPVCRLEDVETYFDSVRYDNLSYMNFAIKTREEHIDKLRAVTHVDGTARVQTVTKEQNTILHDLLSEFDGVLLNTSFNVKGSPILNTLKEAFYMLDETTLDHLVVVDEHNTIWIF
jgi:predicted NodU family carbamoyl transferase